MSIFLQARFLTSASSAAGFPPDDRLEVAFAGRSNVGKSSAINALTSRRRLAIASRTPGRTRTINFFELGAGARLVDLPGYGYAAVPLALRASWEKMVAAYFCRRRLLAGVVVVMDARHPMTEPDRRLLDWLHPFGLRLLVLLTKSDRLPRALAKEVRAAVCKALRDEARLTGVIAFSALRGTGTVETRALLEGWLAPDAQEGGGCEAIASQPRNKRPPVKGKVTGGEAP